MEKTILVTGAAGFIGYHISKRLIKSRIKVIGFDNLNNYYDSNLKKSRLDDLTKDNLAKGNWEFTKGNLEDKEILNSIF